MNTEMTLTDKTVLLIIGGGVAAYKSLDLARRLMEQGARVRTVLTAGGQEFITPLSAASLTGEQCFTDLFDLKDESEMGHIRLSREADVLVVAPATADLMAKMAAGLAGDLASTVLLATDKPVMVAPAMNAEMWAHPATQRNLAQLSSDGIAIIPPGEGMLACGEVGPGRLAEVADIVAAIEAKLVSGPKPLAGRHIVVTAGPTHEPIDPVRYIANRSSGQQGFVLAGACAALGARVTLVAGPVTQQTPQGVSRVDVETAREMMAAVDAALPADAFLAVAAVADWRADGCADQKLKKSVDGVPALSLTENPDILKTVARRQEARPALVIGFAAETQDVVPHAVAKRERKGCDWIVANDVSVDASGRGVMGGARNQVHLITADGVDSWPDMAKGKVAAKLAAYLATALKGDAV